MATEAEIPAPICDIRNEGREHDRDIVDEATIVSICKLSLEDKVQADEPKEPLTLEGDNFLITPSAGEVQSEIHKTLPEASKVAEKLDQAAKDGPESLLRSLKSGDQPLELGANEEPDSERDQKNAEEGRSVAPVECSKIENLNAEVNVGNDKTGEGKTTDENTSFILTNDASKEECQNIQNTMTTEQETMAEGSQESSALESITETTDDSAPKVIGKIENSLTQGDGSHMECNLQLDEENEQLPVTEVSTGSTIGHGSWVDSNIRDKDEGLKKVELLEIEKDTSTLLEEELQMEKSNSGHADRATSSLEEKSTGADPRAAYSEDTEEKTIDTPETKKEVIEVQGTPKSCLISHEEENITGDPQEILSTSKDEKCVYEVGMQKDALEIVSNEEIKENLMIKVDDSQMEIEGLLEGGKTPSISLEREANDDELMVRYEVQSVDGQQKKAVLCENEEHTEGTLPKIETKMEKEEGTLHVDPEENKASDLGREVEDSQGILDEQTDNETVDAATREEPSSSLTLARETKDDQVVMHDVQNEDGQMKKAELCEYEEYAENTLPNIESKMEKEVGTLHVASEEIKASNSGQKLETSSLEEQSLTANSQGILDEQMHDKTTEAATREETPYSVTFAKEANDGEVVVEQEVQNEDEQLKKAELCENEEHAENTLPKAETKMEKGKDAFHVVSEENKPSDLRQEEETSSLEQKSLTADPQGIRDKQTGNITVYAATNEEALENVARVDSNEQTEENSLIHFEGLQVKLEEHLEKGSEKPPSIQNFTGDTNDVTLKDEFKLEDENPSAELLEKENNTESFALMDEEHTEKSGKSLNDFGQSTEISCFEEPSLPENQQAILDDKTEDKTIDAEVTDHIPQKPENVATNVSKEDDDQNPSIQVDAPQMKHEEEHLEKKTEPSEEASSEKKIQTADLQEIPSDNAEVADTTEEDKKDVATNISNRGYDDTSPTAENSSPESSQKEVSTSKSSDHEPENALEATLEDGSSSAELDENEKSTEKELEKPSTESSSVKLIQTEDLQKDSSDSTKKEIAEEANTEEESAKDTATNGETSPTEDDSQQSHTEVSKASDHEPVNMLERPQFEDESSLKTELVENEKCPEKEIDKPSTEASSEKQIRTPDLHEILSSKAKEQTTEVADTKEESTKDIATYVPNQENEDITPVAEDSLQVPSQTETSNSKTGDPEPENTLDAEFGEDESSIKSEIVENEKCVDKEMDKPSTGALIEKQIQPADTQEISSDITKEEITGVVNTEERAQGLFRQDIAIKVPKQENEDTLEEDGSQMPRLKEASTCKASENELEDKFEDKKSVEAELVENEKTTEKGSLKEDVPIEYMHVADKDIEAFASRQEPETNVEDNKRTVSNEDSEELSPFGKDGSPKPSLEEAYTGNTNEVETAIVQEAIYEEEDTTKYDLIKDEETTECKLINEEVSLGSLQIAGKGIETAASVKETETNYMEEQGIATNTRGVIMDPMEDKAINATDLNAETTQNKDDVTTVTHENNKGISLTQVDEEQSEYLEKVIEPPSEVEVLTGYSTDCTLVKQESQVEKSTDSLQLDNKSIQLSTSSQDPGTSSIEEQIITSDLHAISVKTAEEISGPSSVNKETFDEQNITTNAPSEEKEVSSQGEVDNLQNSSLKEVSVENTNEDYTTSMHEAKLEDKNTIITELKERSTEETLTKEESVESLHVVPKDGLACVPGQEGEKTSSSEKECLEANPEKIIYEQKEDKTFDETALKVETPETKDIAADTPRRDSEDNLQVESEISQNPSLEEALKSESTTIHEANNPPQEGQEVNDNIVEKTDQNVSTVAEDTGKKCIEQLVVDGTTKSFLGDERHTESELEERGCKQEKVLPDETEDVQEPTSTAGTTDFITKSPETSELNTFISGKEVMIDREELHAGKAGDDEAIKVDEDKDKGEDGSKEKTSDFSHATAEATDQDVARLQSDAPEGDSALKILDDGQEVGSVSVEKTSDSISPCEKDENEHPSMGSMTEDASDTNEVEYAHIENTSSSNSEKQALENIVEDQTCGILLKDEDTEKEDERIKAASEIHNDNVLEEDIPSKKNKGEDDNTEYRHVSSCKEDVTTEKQLEGAKQEKCGTIGMHKTEKEQKDSEEGVGKDIEEQQENLLANESLDRSIDENQVKRSIEEGTIITDAEETHAYAETTIEDSKEGITTDSHQENDTQKQEIDIGGTCEDKKEANEKEEVSKVSEKSAQYDAQGPKEEKHENLLANQSLDRSVDQNEVENNIEEDTTIADTEETRVYAKTKTEDPIESITTESGPEDDTEKEEKKIGETCEAKKDPNETEKISKVSEESAQYVVQGTKEEKYENLLANESLDRHVDQNQVERSIEEVTTIADAEETHVFAEANTEDSKEGITTESDPKDNTEKEETNIRETCNDKKEANETEKVFEVSEESAQYDVQGPKKEQHENLLANESLDRSIDQNQVEKSIEEGTAIADTEKTHVYAETKIEDSKESIMTEAGLEDDTKKEEIKIGETCEDKKDPNETEKVSEVCDKSKKDPNETENLSMHDKCLHQKETPTSTQDVTTIVNNEKNYEEDNVHLETKIEDTQEKVVTESFSEDYVKSKEIDMEGILKIKDKQKTEKESEMLEEAVEKAGEGKEEILANAETNLHENEMDSSSKEITNTEAHQSDRVKIERNFVDSKEEIATESQPGDEDAKAFEEAIQEPEEDITEKESIDRSPHQKELENSAKEVATVIHAEEAHRTETDCVHKETKITDSREEIIAESYPKEEAKRQESIEKEICEIKEVAEETMKEPKIIEEAKQEPQEDITENKPIDRSLHQEELKKNIEEEATLVTEQHGADVYLETKIADSREKREAEKYQEYEVKQEEIKEKEICEVQNIADETLKVSRDLEMVGGKALQESESANVDGSLQQKESGKSTEKATALFNNEEVHAEGTAKNFVEKEIESYPEETDEIKKNATQIEKVFITFKGDAEQSVQDLEDNLPENFDKSLHQTEQGKSVEEMATTLNTKDVHGIVDIHMETGAEKSKEKEPESHQENEVKSKEISIEDMYEVKKSGNETESVSNDSEKVVENVVQEPEKLEKGVEVVTTTPEIEKAHAVHPVHIKTGFEETKEEVADKAAQEPEEQEKAVEVCTTTLETENAHGVHPIHMNMGLEESKEEVASSTAASTEDVANRTRSYDFNSEMTKDETLMNQSPDTSVIGAAAEVPERLDKNIIRADAPTRTLQNTEGKIGNADAVMNEQLEVENKGKHGGLPLCEFSQGKESEKLDQKDEICNLQTYEENVMLLERNSEEDAYKADTHSKPTEDGDRTADGEAENGYSSHVKDTSEISHDGSSHDILNSNETSSKECREEKYSNKGNESQISTGGEDLEPVEQTSKTTRVAAAIPEFIAGEDQLALLKASEVERHGEEVSSERKEMADSNILEAEDQLLKNHDLPKESCIRDSDANIAQSDGPLDLHNVRDIGEDVQKLSEGSIVIPTQENPIDTSPVENKEARVSSEDQKGNIIHCVTGREVTPLSETDKHVVQEVDCSENVKPGNSTGKNDNVDPAECPRSEGEILKPRAFELDQAKCIQEESASQETAKSMEKSDLKDTGKPSLSYLFNASTKENRQTADDPVTSKESAIHRDDHQVGENDNVEHDHAKPGQEKCGDEESDEKIRPDMTYEAPVMVDAGDAEVKVAQKKSHNILSGVGSKVKHSISKVKKAITGKSSHHPKPPSPK